LRTIPKGFESKFCRNEGVDSGILVHTKNTSMENSLHLVDE